jgi:hypothetical protein
VVVFGGLIVIAAPINPIILSKTRYYYYPHVPPTRDNIKMDLKEIRWMDVEWIHMAQVRDQWRALVNTVVNV